MIAPFQATSTLDEVNNVYIDTYTHHIYTYIYTHINGSAFGICPLLRVLTGTSGHDSHAPAPKPRSPSEAGAPEELSEAGA